MIVKLLTEHHLEFLSLKGGCRGSSESTHVKMPHCWKPHALAQLFVYFSNVVQGNMRPISMEDIQYGVNKIKESKQTMKDSISMIQLD